MTAGPYYYRLYDLVVRSAFRLEEADECLAAAPGLDIVVADLSRHSQPFDGFRHFAILPEGDLLRFRNVGSFLVRAGGREIAVDLDPAFDPRLLALPLLGPVIAILMHRLGYMVLHGSAVELDGQAAVFLGDKGAGKSTTAASLVSAGYPLIADDVVAVRLLDDVPVAAAGYQAMKLDAHMEARFGPDAGHVIEPSDGPFTSGKIRFRLNRENPCSPLPLGTIHVLERSAANSFRPFEAVDTFQALIRFSYFPRLGRAAIDKGESADLFAKAARLAGHASVGRLTVRNGLDWLPELASFLSHADRRDHALA
ncbi:HPr kinase/phosphorylase [Sphingopyxis sp. JAI128]|uniref:HPr kinase/phosphorylase n=1 Tax=Sphingopyxis sp. JAI128 TaxID=2723066 RepID=UPI00160C03C6|nr:hypothetical protein [Sphingopyxis sp. JAI128]MBB6427176.1 hypothetical protein [Sphingopyxis sp. JAI128]